MRAICVVLTLLLASCSGWFGGPEEPPLPGERIDLLATISATEADEAVASLEIRLPAPSRIRNGRRTVAHRNMPCLISR